MMGGWVMRNLMDIGLSMGKGANDSAANKDLDHIGINSIS